MDELLSLDIENKYNIFNIQADITVGDLGTVVAGHKFYELSNVISSANYSITQADKNDNINIKSFFLRYAILDYNACYDYFEQIIYFAFDFFPDFYSVKEFKKIIKDKCRYHDYVKINNEYVQKDTEFTIDINKLISTNAEADAFFREYRKRCAYVNDDKFGIRQWANNIKHQGGFWFEENLNHQGVVKCTKNDKILFSTENLLAYRITHKEAFTRLLKQNRNIIDLANWLFSYIFGDTTYINFSQKKKKFSANKNQFYKIEKDYIYATKL